MIALMPGVAAVDEGLPDVEMIEDPWTVLISKGKGVSLEFGYPDIKKGFVYIGNLLNRCVEIGKM